MSAPRVVTVYINEYRPAEGGVEWIVEIGVDPNEGSIEGEREFAKVGEAAEWAVKWCRDRGYDSELLISFSAARTQQCDCPIPWEEGAHASDCAIFDAPQSEFFDRLRSNMVKHKPLLDRLAARPPEKDANE